MYNIIWYNSIQQIDLTDWVQVFPNELLKSMDIFRVMEESFKEIIKYHYLCVYSNDNIIAILPCFEYVLNLDVVAPKNIQNTISKVRHYIKDFFSVKVFVVGSYIATCEQYIGIRKDLQIKDLTLIQNEIAKKTTSLNCKITMIKEVPSSQLPNIKIIFSNFTFVDSLPNSYIPLKGLTPYPSSLSTKARQRYNKAKRDFVKHDLKFEMIKDFKEYSQIAHLLYLNVLNKSNSKFERLNEDFFNNSNDYFGDNSFLLLIKDSKGIIRSIELIFQCNHKLIPIYIGIDYTYHDVKCLYFNTIAYSIELAEKKGSDYVVLGQNNYYPKALSGAIIERGFLGFHSTNIIYSFLIKMLFKSLFPPFKNDAGVFYNKNSYKELDSFCSEFKIDMLKDQRKNKTQ